MDETAYCSYYGRHESALLTKETVGIYIVDQAYKQLLEKYEQRLIVMQDKLIKSFKKSFADQFKVVDKSIVELNERIILLEKAEKKEKKKEKKKCDA